MHYLLALTLGMVIGSSAAYSDWSPQSAHLGDGTITDHFYPIRDWLAKNPGSPLEAKSAVAAEGRARQPAKNGAHEKPPSANVVESEFSHLLAAIAKANGLLGATIYNRYGIAVGHAGHWAHYFVVPDSLIKSVVEFYKGKESLAFDNSKGSVKWRKICLMNAGKKCQSRGVAVYRLVSDEQRLLGISVVVVAD